MAEIFAEHSALTAGTNIDISGLDYDVYWKKVWCVSNGPIKNKLKVLVYRKYQCPVELRGCSQIKNFILPSSRAVIHSFPDANQSELPDGSSILLY